MANLQESAQWEAGIYQIETTDPVLGGPNGISNVQGKQLANRTKFLKQFADELTTARGASATLAERLANYDAFDPEGQNAMYGAIVEALGLAGLAAREIQKTIRQRMQSGTVLIANRGVINGCVVSKSAGAVRNLSLSAGAFFINGLQVPCPGEENGALVPSNPGAEVKTCYAYLFIDGSGVVQFSTTEFGAAVPDGGLPLYLVTVPAGNTEATDPNLASVTLSDVRRVESGYPTLFSSLAYGSVALPFSMGGSDYAVFLEVLDAKGGWAQRGSVYPGDKGANGFKIYVEGSIDSVSVRWNAVKLGL